MNMNMNIYINSFFFALLTLHGNSWADSFECTTEFKQNYFSIVSCSPELDLSYKKMKNIILTIQNIHSKPAPVINATPVK